MTTQYLQNYFQKTKNKHVIRYLILVLLYVSFDGISQTLDIDANLLLYVSFDGNIPHDAGMRPGQALKIARQETGAGCRVQAWHRYCLRKAAGLGDV